MTLSAGEIDFIGFDVYGTVVDWRSSVSRAAAPFLALYGIDIGPDQFADEWRALYQPAMERVRSGERPFVTLDVLNAENMRTLLSRHGAEVGAIPEHALLELNAAWERLDPWPDVLDGLRRLKAAVAIGPLSNGEIAGMLRLARYAKLPWDVIVGAEIARTYKPQPEAYLASARAVGAPPARVAMLAAHNDDLEAARACGMRTIFVPRRTEYGRGQVKDLEATQAWDVVGDSFTAVADALGCPSGRAR